MQKCHGIFLKKLKNFMDIWNEGHLNILHGSEDGKYAKNNSTKLGLLLFKVSSCKNPNLYIY